MSYRDLFKGTGKYYATYRPGYPDQFFQDIVKKFSLDGTGTLLDLGCGTGQLTIPLSSHFEKVIAMDPEPEMLLEGKKQAHRQKVRNIEWIPGDSTTLNRRYGSFKLVVMGRSFHWMDRDKILKKLFKLIESDGGIVIVYDMDYMFHTKIKWKKAVRDIIDKYLGQERRAGSGIYQYSKDRHETVIKRSPFKKFITKHYRVTRSWTPQSIIGHLYSTSFSSRAVLGKKRIAFEKDLKRQLHHLSPQRKFTEKIMVEALYISKPR